MKSIFRIIYKIHKWLGIPLLVLFSIWYISGMVMLYQRFPRFSASSVEAMVPTPDEIAEIEAELPDTMSTCSMYWSGRHLITKAGRKTIGAYRPDSEDLELIARSLKGNVAKVDTVRDLDRWIPFGKTQKKLPAYRIITDDDTYIYVSSVTGEILQVAPRDKRLWSYIGSIPHYFYYIPLTRHEGLRENVVLWLAGISTFSVLLGIVISVYFIVRKHRWHLFRSRWWEWHYVASITGGLFMLMFIFSGMMSLWHFEDAEDEITLSKAVIHKADFNFSLLARPFGECTLQSTPLPYFSFSAGRKSMNVACNADCEASFPADKVLAAIQSRSSVPLGQAEPVSSRWLYPAREKPGMQVMSGSTLVYWNDKGYYKEMTPSSRLRYYLYSIPHNLRLPGLKNITWLRKSLIWILLFSGLAITVTGGVLSFRALRRLEKGKHIV